MFSQKINNIVVNKIPIEKELDNRPTRYQAVFPDPFCNVALISKTGGGKTTVIYTLADLIVGNNSDTKVRTFCTTIFDNDYKAIEKLIESKHGDYEAHTSIFDNDEDQIAKLKDEYESQKEDDEDDKIKEAPKWLHNPFYLLKHDDIEEEPKERKKRKSKYKEPAYLCIFDDLSTELRSKNISGWVKLSRHYGAINLLSTQYEMDLNKDARKQIKYWLLFNSFDRKKIDDLYRIMDLNCGQDTFWNMYQYATSVPFGFLYVDTKRGLFRKGLDTLLNPKMFELLSKLKNDDEN